MADQLRTKQELLALFADNAVHAITPQVMRDFVVSNKATEVQSETAPAQPISEFTDVFIAFPGATDATLPTAVSYGERSLVVANASGGDFTLSAAGGDTVGGLASVEIGDEQFASLVPDGTNWVVLVRTQEPIDFFTDLDDTPADYVGQADKFVKVNAGETALEYATNLQQYVDGNISGSVAVTNIISGVLADINDVLVAGQVSPDFTVNTTDIEYTGVATKTFAVDASLSSTKTAGAVANYTYALVVNGFAMTELTASLANATFGTSSIHDILTLNTNDLVKVQIRGEATDDDIIVGDFTLRLVEIM